MNKEVTERRGRNHHGEGLPPLRFPGGHASHLHIINSVGNFSLLRNHIPKGKREWPVIYLFMANKFPPPGLGLAPSPRATGGKAYGFTFCCYFWVMQAKIFILFF